MRARAVRTPSTARTMGRGGETREAGESCTADAGKPGPPRQGRPIDPGGLRRASRLADDAVGTRAKTRGTRKLWRPYDPGNKRVVTTQARARH